MSDSWNFRCFEDAPLEVIDGDRGTNYPKQADFSTEGYCLFLNAGNVTQNGFEFSDCAFISKEKDESLRKGKLTRHDSVLTTRGTVGNVALYDDSISFDDVRINSGMVIVRPDRRDLDSKFLNIFLRSKAFSDQVEALTTGSAQPQLPIRDIKRIELPIPRLEEQASIAEVIASLDEKIELNRKQNRTLEAIAQALFKHWFVDFEFPDENGQPYKSSGGAMQPSELGEIPVGWQPGTFSQEFDIVMGQSPSGDTYNDIGDGVVFFQGRTDFGFRFPDVRMYCSEPKKRASKGDILLSVRAPVGDINLAYEDCCIGRGLSAVQSPFKSYAFYKLRASHPIFEVFESEGTVFGSISKSGFESIESVIPTEYMVSRFEQVVAVVDEKIRVATSEIRTLTSLRDTLLPKLMSGELRVTQENAA